MQQGQVITRHPFQFIIQVISFLAEVYRRITKTNLRVTGAGKVENQGIYYNVIFHMVYRVPKKEYTIEKIEAEAVIRFNLHKCIILDINDLNSDRAIALPSKHTGSGYSQNLQLQDELKYAILC